MRAEICKRMSPPCRERGLYPKQVVNRHAAPNMTEIKELQRRNNELIRQKWKLERELQKKEKALSDAATLLMLAKKRDQLWPWYEEE